MSQPRPIEKPARPKAVSCEVLSHEPKLPIAIDHQFEIRISLHPLLALSLCSVPLCHHRNCHARHTPLLFNRPYFRHFSAIYMRHTHRDHVSQASRKVALSHTPVTSQPQPTVMRHCSSAFTRRAVLSKWGLPSITFVVPELWTKTAKCTRK